MEFFLKTTHLRLRSQDQVGNSRVNLCEYVGVYSTQTCNKVAVCIYLFMCVCINFNVLVIHVLM